ncbi:MAG TPA: ROK family protein [Steroidobacteraceae bacterium]|jgi:fructokinase|nr:ROK family protein [Steroidobacteraceae bacterium]
MSAGEQIYGAVEAGGTKFLCAVGHGVHDILEERRIATREPAETLAEVLQFFHAMQLKYGRVRGFGIASFGPIQLDRRAPDWGRMLATPKPGWANANLVATLQPVADCAIELDTDVNAAALAEAELGAGQGCSSVAYVTVGTGIGAGVAIDNHTLRGRMHPEMGHIHVRRDPRDLTFPGICPFHGDCLEGVASGLAIQRRWQSDLCALPEDHVAYSIVGGYLGQLAATIALVTSAERIVFSGGVLENGLLLPHIRNATRDALAGYLPPHEPDGCVENSVCVSALHGRAGLLGAMILARRADAAGVWTK